MGETDGEVTAWIALSNVTIEAGCMRFIPGSHNKNILKHEDTFHKDNLLSRGQEIKGISEKDAIFAPLRPGEMSLHHGKCLHASGINNSNERHRIWNEEEAQSLSKKFMIHQKRFYDNIKKDKKALRKVY